jgi:hypothetical protein
MRRGCVVTWKVRTSIFVRRIRVTAIAAWTREGVIKRAGGVTNGP